MRSNSLRAARFAALAVLGSALVACGGLDRVSRGFAGAVTPYRVEIVQAKTRTPGSPYYQINPSGRVPYLVDDDGAGMEDSQLICASVQSPGPVLRLKSSKTGTGCSARLRAR